jgi:hypothetical protein
MIPVINAVAVLLYIVSGVYILRRYKKIFVFYALYFGFQVWALVSCFYNDLSVYNPELFDYTRTTLATTRLAVFYLAFNLGFFITAYVVNNRPLTRNVWHISGESLNLGNIKLLGMVLIALVFGYEGYTFWREGIPVLQGIDRLAFAREAGPVEDFLMTYGYALAFLLGYYRKKRKGVSFTGTILSAFVLYTLATGHKFSALVGIVVPYYAPIFVRYLAQHPQVNPLRFKYLSYVGGVVVGILCFSFITYWNWIGSSSGAQRFLTHRVLANQGEIWWAVDNDYFTSGVYDRQHWEAELEAILNRGKVPEENYGMKYLMLNILGPDKAYVIFDKGYLYTMAYPAILIMTFPYLAALAVQIAAGMFFFALVYYLYYCVLYRHVFRAMLTLLILWPFMTVMATGNFVVFVTVGMVLKVILLVIMEFGLLRTKVT